jgi:lipopolysaccharide transport system ATP-binding protein
MRDLAADPPLAIRVAGVGGTFGMPLGSTRPRAGAFGRLLRRILGLKVAPARVMSMTGRVELKDLSFEIAEGSAVCIAGGAGAAKSALLRMLAGASIPTTGRIEMRGPVASILEIGDNLDLGLTAMQNIEAQRRLRHVTAAEAKDFAEEVLAFAELGGFEHVPVRKYSTGMRMRLSLALALQGNPPVLLMDDVLGVGDAAFQRKCADRLLELREAGCTIVLATSDEALVDQLATRVITLGYVGILADGSPARTFPEPAEDGALEAGWHVMPNLPEGEAAALKAIGLSERREAGETFVDLTMAYDIRRAPQSCRPLLHIMRGRLTVLRSLYPNYLRVEEPGDIRFTVAIPINLLPSGHYRIDVAIVSEINGTVHPLKANAAAVLDVKRGTLRAGSASPLISPVLPWEIEPVAEGAP